METTNKILGTNRMIIRAYAPSEDDKGNIKDTFGEKLGDLNAQTGKEENYRTVCLYGEDRVNNYW